MTWQQYGDLAFYACAVVSLVFVVVYMLLAPWWRTTTGRNIMAVMASVALTFCYFAYAIKEGGVPYGFYPIRAMLFTAVFLSIGWRIVILIRAQTGARKENNRVEELR